MKWKKTEKEVKIRGVQMRKKRSSKEMKGKEGGAIGPVGITTAGQHYHHGPR